MDKLAYNLPDDLVLRQIGAQSRSSRFGKPKMNISNFPSRAPGPSVMNTRAYRANLVGLSQRYNLLFIAYKSSIMVHEPKFPDQSLNSQPEVLAPLPKSGAKAIGEVDPSQPHAINRLQVGVLGFEEVLIAVCDDGDVVGFLTRHLRDLVESRKREGGDPMTLPRPFMFENVGRSAWGIAIHSETRKVAISSNSREITVFELALNLPSGMPRNSHISETVLILRRGGCRFRVPLNNTPALSFCNTGHDPQGRYLVAMDIEGTMVLCDVLRGEVVEKSYTKFCTPECPSLEDLGRYESPSSGWLQRCGCDEGYPHAVWGVEFLDPKAFRRNSKHSVTGHLRHKYIDMTFLAGAADKFTATWENTPRRGKIDFRGHEQREDERQRLMPDPLTVYVEQKGATKFLMHPDDIFTLQGKDMLLRHCNIGKERTQPPLPPILFYSQVDIILQQSVCTPPHQEQTKRIVPLAGQAYPLVAAHSPIRLHEAKPRPPVPLLPEITSSDLMFDSDADDEDDGGDGGDGADEDDEGDTVPGLSYDVRLYNSGPEVFFCHATIPELGVVVIADRRGRAIILDLVRGELETGQGFASFTARWTILPKEGGKDTGGSVLPCAGVAASPMQGAGPSNGGERRWRVIMYFTDHSVLSFELYRTAVGGMKAEWEE